MSIYKSTNLYWSHIFVGKLAKLCSSRYNVYMNKYRVIELAKPDVPTKPYTKRRLRGCELRNWTFWDYEQSYMNGRTKKEFKLVSRALDFAGSKRAFGLRQYIVATGSCRMHGCTRPSCTGPWPGVPWSIHNRRMNLADLTVGSGDTPNRWFW